MSTPFETETYEHAGHTVRIEYFYDSDSEPPWENDCGSGPVRKANRSHNAQSGDKKPGERPMNSPDRNEYQFYYDWAAACKMARADGWNAEPYDAPNRIARAVQANFDFLCGYINQNWHYAGIVCTLLDAEGEETDITDSCWGFETWQDYHLISGHEMAQSMIESHVKAEKAQFVARMREARERKYWANRDVVTS